MKKTLLLCLVLLAMLALAAPTWAAVSENFDGLIKNSYAPDTTWNSWRLTNALTGSGTEARGGTGRCVRIRNVVGSALAYWGTDGLGKDGGVGVFDFWYKSFNGNSSTVKIVTTVGGVSVDSTGITTTSTTYLHFTRTINNPANDIVIKVTATSTVQFDIDDFSIADFAMAGNETDARIAAGGPGAQPTISSLLTTEPQAQVAFSFNMRDEGTGTLPTIIRSLTVGQGTGNQAADWTLYLAGAKITDGVNTYYGTIHAGDVTFSGSPTLVTLPNGGPWQTWTLSVWLKNSLPYNADNKILEFRVSPTSFVTDSTGAGFNPADAPVSSGATNDRVSIVGTRLAFTTQPPTVAFKDTSFTLRAGFTDIYGGIDADYNEPVSLAVNTGTGVLSAVSGLTKTSTTGEAYWNDLKYNTIENGVILQVTSPTYPAPVLANPMTFTTPPSIAIDAFPTCWDGDTTNMAMPFVVHISITNWLAYANQSVYVKVFNSTLGNPYHYTSLYGWSKETNYDRKPIVTLDASGNWAGWLALKSYGMNNFKPRAALVTNTATNITGATVTGTLLDLSDTGNGAVVEDRDGGSHSTPGNIILLRNGSGTIVGSWIVEDNGYPLDEGYTDIASGGWRLAICAFCNELATFESWAPATWPGHGTPQAGSREPGFCIYPGESVEISDVILPIELMGTPTATAGDGEITLSWATASETGNSRFDILRNGALVGKVDGAGSSPTHHSYRFTDNGLVNGTTYTYTLHAVGMDGSVYDIATLTGTPNAAAATITEYALHQNYPNPFNPTTSIVLDLVEKGFVSLKVYNLMGQEVAAVVNCTMDQGRHVVSFDASHLSSGIYLYRLNVNGFVAEKKMLLMK